MHPKVGSTFGSDAQADASPALGAVAGRCVSDQPQSLQAGMPVAPDDDVVVNRDAERLCGLDDLAGHPDVGGRRARVSGRMVVHQNEGRGREFERPFHNLAG